MLLLRELKAGRPLRLRHIRLNGAILTFGRATTCTHKLETCPGVSRVQATLKQDCDGWWISDGGINPSATGVRVGNRRIDQPIKMTPGLEVSLFWSPDYQATLEFLEVDIDVDRSTDEIDLSNLRDNDLQDLVAKLSRQVDLLSQRMEHLEASHNQIAQDISERLEAKITALADELHQAHSKNSEQDRLIRNTLTGMAVALITICAHNLSRGDSEAIDKAFSAFGVVIGGGGAALASGVIPGSSQKPRLESRSKNKSQLELTTH